MITWVLLMAFTAGEAEILYKREGFQSREDCEAYSERIVQETKATIFESLCEPKEFEPEADVSF